MRVGDIMTRTVVSVPPETPVLALAALLAERSMAAVPVTDSRNRLLGIVSEADLVHRLAPDGSREPNHALGATARDVMTQDLVTASEAMTAERAAELITSHGVRRLPVVQDGQLVGTVSRADLLRAALAPPLAPDETAADAGIRLALRAAMDRRPWSEAPQVFFEVRHAAVMLHGRCPSAAVHRALVAMAAGVAGVRLVQDRISAPSPGLGA